MAELQTGPHEVDVEHIMLKGPDGTPSTPSTPGPTACRRAGSSLHPDIMGVRPLFDDLCRRLATHGFAVCAPEPFVRAPVDVRGDADRRARMGYVKELDDELQLGDLEAAADYLVVHDDVREVAVARLLHGRHVRAEGRGDRSLRPCGRVLRDDPCARRLARAEHPREPLDTAADVCPTLAIFGGSDPFTPAADIDALRAAWADRPDCEIVVYPDAEHGFVHDPSGPRTAPTTPPTPGAACSRSSASTPARRRSPSPRRSDGRASGSRVQLELARRSRMLVAVAARRPRSSRGG